MSCRVPRAGDPTYVLFWMAGCSHCDVCKQQLGWCRDCSCVRSVQVGRNGSISDPAYTQIFNTYSKGSVPFLAIIQDGRYVKGIHGPNEIVSVLREQ